MSQTISKPVPVPDEISAPFFDGARNGQLMLQHCTACHAWSFPVRERCPHCFAAKLEWRQASGRGSLYTFTVMPGSFDTRFSLLYHHESKIRVG